MRYFAIDLTTLPKSNVSGKTVYQKPKAHFKRFLYDNELFFIVKGNLQIQQCDNINAQEGEIIFNLKNLHQIGTKPSICTFYWLHFDSDIETFDNRDDAMEFCNKNPRWIFLPEHFKLQQIERVETLWAQLNHFSLHPNDNSKLFRDSLTSAIIAEISYQSANYIINVNAPNFFKDIIEYINSHITEKLTISDLADKTRYNIKYFSILFHKYMGKTFKTYVNETRLSMAVDYLLNSNEPIKSIASKIGFEDEYYFMKIFKKASGLSPKHYRNKYGSGIYS